MANPARLNDRRNAEFGGNLLDPDDRIDRLMPVIQAGFLIAQRDATKGVGFDSLLTGTLTPRLAGLDRLTRMARLTKDLKIRYWLHTDTFFRLDPG